MDKEKILTSAAPAPTGIYSQGVLSGRVLFISGQLPFDPGTGHIVGQTAAEQTERALKNLSAVVEEAGFEMDDITKVTLFMKNLGDLPAVEGAYGPVFVKSCPALSVVGGVDLPEGALVQVEAIAHRAERPVYHGGGEGPDFARGLNHDRKVEEHPDYARGLDKGQKKGVEPDYGRGLDENGEKTVHPDYSRGLKDENRHGEGEGEESES